MLRILQALLILAVFGMVPFFMGFALHKKQATEAYVYGQTFMWALFQVFAVPMVLFRMPFRVLLTVYVLAVCAFCIHGILWRRKAGRFHLDLRMDPLMILALLIILGQAGMYVLGQHVDEDDSRWIAEANDALLRNRMLLDNPATGAYIGHFAGEMLKDVFSPFSMYMAVLSGCTLIRPTVMAHTVYAPVLLLVSYMVYVLIGKELFSGKRERGAFVLGCAVINLFFAGNTMTQSMFTMVRIWQGKAVVAAVIIPLFLLLFLKITNHPGKGEWLWLIPAGAAACLLSGMGVPIALIMTAVYGIYAAVVKGMKFLPYVLLSMILPVLFGLGYYWLKG